MKRREFLYGIGGMAGLIAYRGVGVAVGTAGMAKEKVIGMYIHQHWPYKHPYAARTWTVEDYRGYASALKKLGVNTLVIWPMIEIMPDPLTPSDQASLAKIGRVIDVLHELDMRVLITFSANIIADNHAAEAAPFEKRHYFYCNKFVNPGDPVAIQKMVDWRAKLMRPLAKIDGIVIIDSDPGGYPGSTNSEFVNILELHRRAHDQLRPGIELYYWMHVGWEAYCRYYQTGNFSWGTPAEAVDILTKLKKVNPHPWGITIHTMDPPPNGTDLKLAERFGVASTSLAFNYGAIEGEPTFPMTNFGGNAAYQAGRASAPGGVVGNAQTHCVQLPNTYAFFRGATGAPPPTDNDYTSFADELIEGHGPLIMGGWKALSTSNSTTMRNSARKLAASAKAVLTPGPLSGLLFGSPQRFLTDLEMELEVKAAFVDYVSASERGGDLTAPLAKFVETASAWQMRHGYECAWSWPEMTESLKKLHSARVDEVLDEKGEGKTPADQIQDHFKITESYTPRLLQAMREAAKSSS
jgi:hypothetical protein